MKVISCFFTAFFCFTTFLTHAQIEKSKLIRVGGTNPPVNVKTWSDWVKNSGNPNLEASYAKLTDNEITLKLRNTGKGTMEGEFTANECPDNQKGINGWKRRAIEPGATITLTFPTGGCNAGFHWWSQNLVVWSDWFQLNPANYISARWIKRGTTISIELLNQKEHSINLDVAANFCGETQKGTNGWHHVHIYSKERAFLNIPDVSSGRCNEGFHLWYKNLRGPQQIDDGTELVPVDGN